MVSPHDPLWAMPSLMVYVPGVGKSLAATAAEAAISTSSIAHVNDKKRSVCDDRTLFQVFGEEQVPWAPGPC